MCRHLHCSVAPLVLGAQSCCGGISQPGYTWWPTVAQRILSSRSRHKRSSLDSEAEARRGDCLAEGGVRFSSWRATGTLPKYERPTAVHPSRTTQPSDLFSLLHGIASADRTLSTPHWPAPCACSCSHLKRLVREARGSHRRGVHLGGIVVC